MDVRQGEMTQDDTTGWYEELKLLGEESGHFERLGPDHSALFCEDGPVLLVSFERAEALRADDGRLPMGHDMAEESGWSSLVLLTEGDTWFRDGRVYGYFDRLVDDGFFDEFERVVFYGAGMCGYAACAYSVAAPGATVLAVAPQATLDPRVSEWDPRFIAHRRLCFTDRYGYAPDMLEAADRAYILYDPEVQLDAMQAALFTRPNAVKLRCRHLNGEIETDLDEMGVLPQLIDAACEGQLSEMAFYRLYRARRNSKRYLFSLLDHLTEAERPYLAAVLCHHVMEHQRGPRFRKRLRELEAQFAEDGRPLPWQTAAEDTAEA